MTRELVIIIIGLLAGILEIIDAISKGKKGVLILVVAAVLVGIILLIPKDGSDDRSGSTSSPTIPPVTLTIPPETPTKSTSTTRAIVLSQGVELPEGFVLPDEFVPPVNPTTGEMRNTNGNSYEAVYKYKDATGPKGEAYAYGNFKIPNDSISSTLGRDGSVTCYGHYNGYGLFCHAGEFFWANPKYYKIQG